ncbi:hypothetical protein SAMN02745945_01730 [Peptoclostridium litorale DSM 5388]|uniref:Copper amine oxidase-like N-terminal domain-containing protein n=1 Tax=Peptoclostridium litorale DSM 5388 TaxID=1121324 RepID=A0A069RGT1_PEPLI|nr:hypothetical protein [Peptoclostridium litorale]KDR95998.1 hypothetical protein CLIT_5c00080 [Peptoclostridium litorale DSM 5388]SIO06960.1 hypothetical protein SAMN02745945_01730 [Peptoclostridium litorale DSM 5388]
MRFFKMLSACSVIIFTLLFQNVNAQEAAKLGKIVYEEEQNIYIEYGGDILKLRKDFASYYEHLSEGEKMSVRQNVRKDFKSSEYSVKTDIPGVVDLGSGRFKYFSAERLENKHKDLGKTIGSFGISDAVLNLGRTDGYYGEWIPSYVVDGELYIVAENLADYGYSVDWDEKNRITVIDFEEGKQVTGTKSHIKESGSIYESDVEIWIDGAKMNSYNIGGYSLISARQLEENPDMMVFRDYDEEDRSFKLSGKISLPKGQTAPNGGLSGNLVVYTYGYKGAPEEIAKYPFSIPEGGNSIKYFMDEQSVQKEKSSYELEYQDIFIGYEIEENENYIDGKLTNEDGQPAENYGMFVCGMDDYSVDYENFNMEIFPKAKLSGSIRFEDNVKTLFSDGLREIRVEAVNADNPDECISKTFEVGQNETDIPYSMELIGDKNYLMHYEIKLHGIFLPRYGIWAGGEYPNLAKGYLGTDGGIVDDMEKANIINMSSDMKDMDVSVPAPDGNDLVIATVEGTDISVYVEGQKVRSVNIGGNMAIYIEDLKGAGFDAAFNEDGDVIYLSRAEGQLNGDGKDWEFDQAQIAAAYVTYTDIKACIGEKKIDLYNYADEMLVLVKNLKIAGLKVEFDGEKRRVDIYCN